MSAAHVLVCDVELVGAPIKLLPTASGVCDRYPCTARSRAAATDAVLREVAGRDGWVRDGVRDLCPFHAAEATP